jgi:hypothetical protein
VRREKGSIQPAPSKTWRPSALRYLESTAESSIGQGEHAQQALGAQATAACLSNMPVLDSATGELIDDLTKNAYTRKGPVQSLASIDAYAFLICLIAPAEYVTSVAGFRDVTSPMHIPPLGLSLIRDRMHLIGRTTAQLKHHSAFPSWLCKPNTEAVQLEHAHILSFGPVTAHSIGNPMGKPRC